jgi:ribosomal protein S18 acetylase RimI-like enzyme
MHYRKAKIDDIKRLVEIENLSFDYDQLDANRFHYFIQKGHCDLIVQIKNDVISAYSLVLYRHGTKPARVYSIAVHKDFSGQGLGEKMMLEIEKFVQQHNRFIIRLEVKVSNQKAITLYEKMGYTQFARKTAYYNNQEDALCLEKCLCEKLQP